MTRATSLRLAYVALISCATIISGRPALADATVLNGAIKAPRTTENVQRTALTSTGPYQKEFLLDCGGSACTGTVSAPGAGNQLTLTRISCFFIASPGDPFRNGYIELRATSGHVRYENFTYATINSNGEGVVSSNLDIYARAAQFFNVGLQLSTGTMSTAQCAVSGTIGPIP